MDYYVDVVVQKHAAIKILAPTATQAQPPASSKNLAQKLNLCSCICHLHPLKTGFAAQLLEE